MIAGSSSTSSGYQCKRCGKRFGSFQALGGHQGIHRKVVVDDVNEEYGTLLRLNIGPPKLALHRCKLCMKEFETGAALGGHMTRHRHSKEGGGLPLAAVQMEADDHRHKDELILAAKEWRLFL